MPTLIFNKIIKYTHLYILLKRLTQLKLLKEFVAEIINSYL